MRATAIKQTERQSWTHDIVAQWFRSRGWRSFEFQRKAWDAYLAGKSDLIHGRIENQTNLNHLVDKWRQRHKNVELFLATGNHDLRSGDPPHQFRFDYLATEIILGPFIFTHKPRRNSSFYGIA